MPRRPFGIKDSANGFGVDPVALLTVCAEDAHEVMTLLGVGDHAEVLSVHPP